MCDKNKDKGAKAVFGFLKFCGYSFIGLVIYLAVLGQVNQARIRAYEKRLAPFFAEYKKIRKEKDRIFDEEFLKENPQYRPVREKEPTEREKMLDAIANANFSVNLNNRCQVDEPREVYVYVSAPKPSIVPPEPTTVYNDNRSYTNESYGTLGYG